MVPFVEPDEWDNPVPQLASELTGRGVPVDESERLAALSRRLPLSSWWPNAAAQPESADADRSDAFVREAAVAYAHARSVAHARVRLLLGMAAHGVISRGPPSGNNAPPQARAAQAQSVVEALHASLLSDDIALAADAFRETGDDDLRDHLVRVLASCGRVRVRDFIDVESLRERDHFAPRTRIGGGEPDSIYYWLRMLGTAALDDLLALLRDEPAETLERLAGAILQEIEAIVAFDVCVGDRPTSDFPGFESGATVHLQQWREWLQSSMERNKQDDILAARVLAVGALVERLDGEEASESSRASDVRIADRMLGRLRVTARTVAAQNAPVLSLERQDAYSHALHALARQGSLTQALRAGVLLLRALAVPCVGPDLRWWPEAGAPDPPSGWSWLPRALVGVVHAQGAREQVKDPDLLVAREELARFLLDRLKPRDKVGDAAGLLEPSVPWRVGCVRAVRELLVNPGGRGHRVLWEVAHNDPNADVRDAALKAHDALRHASGHPGDTSPRRRILAALWWLRQSHLIELGQAIDSSGARRTRQREISFTSEPRQPAA